MVLNINTEKDIVLFYYYSTPTFPDNCYLEISNALAHRNLFLFKCDDGKIHFEFPVFEDHSYNSICNMNGVRSLIKRNTDEKYIIFRTRDNITEKKYIIGYYKVGKTYYQETNKYNNNGFVCGFESSEKFLLKRGEIIFEDRSFGRGYNVSWREKKINKKLYDFLKLIQKKNEDYSKEYQKETNNLINLFKDENRINEWKEYCKRCSYSDKCYFYNYNEKYKEKNPHSNMYSLINTIYNSNMYSKNVLDIIPKKYIR